VARYTDELNVDGYNPRKWPPSSRCMYRRH
jgi:hypothetical protein